MNGIVHSNYPIFCICKKGVIFGRRKPCRVLLQCPRGFAIFSPRGFAIPEVIIADILSARVTDPQLIPLWIANPQGRANNPQGQMLLIKFRPLAKKRVEN